jgi:hypothetical protein
MADKVEGGRYAHRPTQTSLSQGLMLACAYESNLGERYPEATGTLIGWPLPRDPGASQGIVGLESNLRDGERLAKRKNDSGTGRES